MKSKGWVLEAVIVAVGIAILGFCLKSGIDNFVNKDRKVTVKGLSEKQVPANYVTWPITLKETGNDIQGLYTILNGKVGTVVQFLKKNGVKDTEISVAPPTVTDQNTDNYSGNDKSGRYTITQVVTVSSSNVNLVRGIILKQGELLAQGVAVINSVSYDGSGGVTYSYTSFQSMKPKMVEEAIGNARVTAEQFAKQCGSKLNKIETANQGEFSIDSKDENTPWVKTLRVVSTVTYSLKN